MKNNLTQNEIIEQIDILFGKMEKEIIEADPYGETYINDIYIAIAKCKNYTKNIINNIFDKNGVEPKKDDGKKPKQNSLW